MVDKTAITSYLTLARALPSTAAVAVPQCGDQVGQIVGQGGLDRRA